MGMPMGGNELRKAPERKIDFVVQGGRGCETAGTPPEKHAVLLGHEKQPLLLLLIFKLLH